MKIQVLRDFILHQARKLVLFIFVFSFNSPLPLNSAKIIILFTICLIFTYLLLNRKLILYCDHSFLKKTIFAMFVVIFLVMVFQLTHGKSDFSLPYAFLLFLFEGFIFSIFLIGFYYKNAKIEIIIRDLIDIAVIQAIIILVMLVNSDIRDALFYFQGNQNNILLYERYGGFRGLGLSGNLVYELAVLLGFAQILISLEFRKTSKAISLLTFKWLILMVAISITGRTGFICSLISIMLILFNNKKGKQQLAIIITFIGTLIYFFTNIISIFFPNLDFVIIDNIIFYIQELFVNASTNSTNQLIESYKIKDQLTFLFGMGIFNWDIVSNNLYSFYSDSGYLRHINHHGIFLTLLVLYLYALLWLFVFKKSLFIQKDLSIVVLVLFVLNLIIQIKGDIIFSSGINIKYALIFILGILSHYYYFYDRRSLSIRL